MNKLSLLAAALVALSAQAVSALERQGSSKIDIDGHTIENSFSTVYDPQERSFVRKGTVTLQNGRTGSYEIDGKCSTPPVTCDLSGSGTGPMGRQWTGHGTLSIDGGKTSLKAVLTGPAGKTVAIDRKVDGDIFPDINF